MSDNLEAIIREAQAVALEEAAARFSIRSETFLKTMERMTERLDEYTSDDITRYGAYSMEANSASIWLTTSAADLRKP